MGKFRFSFKNCLVCGLAFLIFSGIFGWWNFFVEVPLEIRPETTILTRPLTADGKYVDYAAYVRSQYPTGMKTEKNAVRGLVLLLGDLNEGIRDAKLRAFLRKQLFEGLGLEAEPKAGFEAEWKPKFALIHVRNRCGDEKLDPTAPEVPAWVEANSPALDAVVEVVKKAEICRFPLILWEEGAPLCWSVQGPQETVWLVANDLIFRANWRLSQGDAAGAVSDVTACRKLGKMMRKNRQSLQEFEWGIRIEEASFQVPFASSPTPLTAEQWQTLSDSLPTESCRSDCRALLENYELFALLDLIQHDFLRKEKAEIDWLPLLNSRLGKDWNAVFRRLQVHWGKEIDFWLNHDVPMIAAWEIPYRTLPRSFWQATRSQRSDYAAKTILAQAGCVLEHGIAMQTHRHDTRRRLSRIGCALELYRLDHDGQLPPAFTADAGGQPLQTWRVLLLPYLGEEELFRQIRLEEPWNSEWNSQFHARMPEVFANDRSFRQQTETEPGWQPGDTTLSFTADESVLVTENSTAGNWMDPGVAFTQNDPLELGFVFLKTDGTVGVTPPPQD